MNERVIVSFFLIFLISLTSIYGKKKKTTHVINYSSPVNTCPDEKSRNFSEMINMIPTRINETSAKLEGDFKFKQELDGLFRIDIKIEKQGITGKEVILTHSLQDFCKEVANKKENNVYGYYIQATNLPNCPIPAGLYEIRNMIADISNVPLGGMLEGSYIITFNFVKYENVQKGFMVSTVDTNYGCLYFECTVEKI